MKQKNILKVLITGGAGFIGSHLSDRLLKKGYEVWAIDDMSSGSERKIQHNLKTPHYHLIKGSILDEKLMNSLVSECDIIYHLAAVVGVEKYLKEPYQVLKTNINGTQVVLELAHKYRKKVIFTSTSEIYGKNSKSPFKEDDDRVLGSTKIDRWCYSTSKATCEHLCFAYSKMGLLVVILRLFNVYGPRLDKEGEGRVISIFISQALNNKPITIIGDGSQVRCFTYIDDAVEGIIRASDNKHAEGEVFNIGIDTKTTINELAKTVQKISNTKSEIVRISAKSVYGKGYEDIPVRIPDITKARKLLRFNPKVGLEEGLKRTITWFKKNIP